jgi:hypothetical protein
LLFIIIVNMLLINIFEYLTADMLAGISWNKISSLDLLRLPYSLLLYEIGERWLQVFPYGLWIKLLLLLLLVIVDLYAHHRYLIAPLCAIDTL